MTQQEREEQIVKAYSKFVANDWVYSKVPCSQQFLESDAYKSIPPATDELRERVEAEIKQLKISMKHFIEDGADPVYDLKHPIIIETLENLLKP